MVVAQVDSDNRCMRLKLLDDISVLLCGVHCLSIMFRISKFPKEIKLKRYLHEMTDVVVAGTKVDGAGEERTPSEQEEAVVKQGKPV